MKRLCILALITLSTLYFTGCNNNSSKNSFTSSLDENESILYVYEKTVLCSDGAGEKQCYKTRNKPSDEWTYLYEHIDNFYYEEGYRYKLKVKIEKIHYPKDQPIADAPDRSITLIKILNKILIEDGVKYEF